MNRATVDPEARVEGLIAKLRARGNRITPQRIAILQVLATSDRHLSAEQIYEQVRADFPTTSLSTIYKTISLLKEMDEVLELGFGDMGSRYEARNPEPHPHLICIRCRKIIDLDASALDDLPAQVARDTGYDIVSHRLDLFGICPECQKREQQEPNTN
ncbi:MAG: Fur family transcriptional regulator [Anaerolineae bacterium]